MFASLCKHCFKYLKYLVIHSSKVPNILTHIISILYMYSYISTNLKIFWHKVDILICEIKSTPPL